MWQQIGTLFDHIGTLTIFTRKTVCFNRDKIDAGEYVIGELVVPKKYHKLVLKSGGTHKQVEFTVSARKTPLTLVRKRELQRCEDLGIVSTWLPGNRV